MVVSWLLMLLTRDGVSASRSVVPGHPRGGDRLSVIVQLRNRSLVPGPQITISDVAGDLDVKKRTVEAESIRPHGERSLTVQVPEARRGVHSLPPVRLDVNDPLGLVRSRRHASEAQEVIVVPRLVALESCALVRTAGDRDHSRARGRASPGGFEFRGIRPHYPGEPLNHVDWKATARTGNLMLRETDEPASGDVTLLLDGAAAGVAGAPPRTNFERAVEVAAAIGDFVLTSGRSLELVVHGSSREPRIGPGAGARRLLLSRLAAARADASLPLLATLYSLESETRDGPLTALVIVTMSLDRQLSRSLATFASRGCEVSVAYVPGRSFNGNSPSGSSSEKRAAESARTRVHPLPMKADADVPLERADDTAVALLSLARAGIPCLTLERGDDLKTSLARGREPSRALP